MNSVWIADTHTDYLMNLYNGSQSLNNRIWQQQHISLEALNRGNVKLQVFAAFVDAKLADPPMHQALSMIGQFQNMLEQWNEYICEYDPNNMLTGKPDKLNALLAIEGGEAIAGDLNVLSSFARLGVKIMTLTWNYENEIGYPGINATWKDLGLKPFGKKCVQEMNRLKIAVDVSHLNDGGFWDVVENSELPLIASHSNARSLCGHSRNLTDDQIRAVIKTKGYIGLNFNPPFIKDAGECTVEDLVCHAEHILSLGGEDVLGFGSDFDGITSTPSGVSGVQDFQAIIETFRKFGINESLITKIAHENFVSYINKFM